jgi:hypothetical protein
MSLIGVSGVLGFAVTPEGALNAIPGIDQGSELANAVSTSATYAGWFLFGVALALGAALLGGWVGTLNAGARAMKGERMEPGEVEERRAA